MKSKLRIEEWIFVGYVATLSLASFAPFQLFPESLQLSDFIFLLASIAWVFAVGLKKRHIRWSWLYLPLIFYAMAVTISTITSANPSRSLIKLFGKFYLIASCFLAFNIITSVKIFKTTVKAWLLGAGITIFFSLLGIILFYGGLKDPLQNPFIHLRFGSLPPGNYPRLEGFFRHPAMLCNFLAIGWAFLLLSKSAGWIKNYKFWIFSISLWIINAFTLTPGLGGIFLASGIFLQRKLFKNGKILSARLTLATGILIAGVFLFSAVITFFAYSPTGSKIPLLTGEISPSHRAQAWSTALRTFSENPFFGRGVGEPIAKVPFKDPSGYPQELIDAHNTYISVLAETGLIGFLAYFSIIGFVIFNLFCRKSLNELQNTIKFCLLIALGDAFFYQSLTGSYEDTRHLWVLFGLAVAISQNNFKDDTN